MSHTPAAGLCRPAPSADRGPWRLQAAALAKVSSLAAICGVPGLGALGRRPPSLGLQLVPAGVLPRPRRSRHHPANCTRPSQASTGGPPRPRACRDTTDILRVRIFSPPVFPQSPAVLRRLCPKTLMPASPGWTHEGSLWVSTPAPDGSCPRWLPAALSSQSMGTAVRDPGLPACLENSSSFFKAQVRWHFLPESSLIPAARTNLPRPQATLTPASWS